MTAKLSLVAAFSAVAALGACRKDEAPPHAAPVSSSSTRATSAQATPLAPGKGRVQGRVRLEGSLVLPAIPTTASVADVCGTELADHSLRVGKGGGLADAIVYLDVEAGPVLEGEPSPVLDQRGCRYAPAVLGARAGGTVKVGNSDPLVHNVRSVADGRSLFNVAMPLEGMFIERKLPPKPGVVSIGCDLHPWMRATIRTFNHGWFTVTADDGTFHLEGLPEGSHTLRIWHPRLPEHAVALELTDTDTRAVNHAWSAEQVLPLEALPRSQQ